MITGTINSMAFGGYGVLKDNGLVIFVPFAAPQDQLTVDITLKKKNFAFAAITSIDAPGPDRTAPPCPYYGTCGGCQLQHLTYPAQLLAKQQFVQDAIDRIAKLPLTIPSVIPAPHQWGYRCHITLRLDPYRTGFQAGFNTIDHTFLPITHCPIFTPDPIISDIQPLLHRLSNTSIQEATLRLFKSDTQYILAFTFSHLPPNIAILEEALANSLIQAILIQSPHELFTYGTPTCHTHSLGIDATFSPFGFLQNFPEQRDNIYRTILDTTPSSATNILDLYCGIGITSLLLAKQHKKVIGVESNAASIDIAQANAHANSLPVTFHKKKVETILPTLLKDFKPDHILCNPPRTGLDPTITQAILATPPPSLHYLSCMPSTLARDLKHFTSSGYTVTHIQPFDMFPQTTHVETLALLTRT